MRGRMIGFKEIDGGGLLSVPGLRGAAVKAGIKYEDTLDLAVVVADAPRTAAGMFTRNRLPAAPVRLCQDRLFHEPRVRSLVINSGNANAMTGEGGERDARAMAERLEGRCGGPALVLSTGIIGVPLPLDRILSGIDRASAELGPGAGPAIAQAILTTDTRPKSCAFEAAPPAAMERGEPLIVGGVAKGSGMIHPDMATMLAVIATNAELTPEAMDGVMRRAVDRSFHEITVDGDTSTNDSVIVLAGGARMPALGPASPDLERVAEGIALVAERLAEMIVEDGEGASRVMEVVVTGGASVEQARKVARSIACSSLVKTALAGGDPNWGRILAAAANAETPLFADELTLTIAGERVFAEGRPLPVDEAELADRFSRDRVEVVLGLGQGRARARMLTTDLTAEYVAINSEYTT